MSKRDQKQFFSKRDITLLVTLLSCVVILIIGYDVYQNSKGDAQQMSLDIPPVVINKLDVDVFDRLGKMKINQ